MGKSLNEKIFENGKIFQYQEINESQEIINHTAINLFTEKTCLSDISEIKKNKEELNLQQSYAEQERNKRIGEMMSEDEKRKVSLINTASGRAALRGKVNKFGTLDARPNKRQFCMISSNLS